MVGIIVDPCQAELFVELLLLDSLALTKAVAMIVRSRGGRRRSVCAKYAELVADSGVPAVWLCGQDCWAAMMVTLLVTLPGSSN
jgi:Na+/H+ antiporter NhaC